MDQKTIWIQEYEHRKDLPSSRTDKPSRLVAEFMETDGATHVQEAFDAGCGKGRNAFFLAQKGIHVTGIDFVESAIAAAQQEAQRLNVADRTTFICQSMADPLPVQDASMDLVIDMMSLHTLRQAERDAYVREVARITKPNGYLLIFTIAAESPAAQALFNEHPGEESNSYIIPHNGAFEKGFTREDIQTLFPDFRVIRLEPHTEFTPAFGDVYERVYYDVILQKK